MPPPSKFGPPLPQPRCLHSCPSPAACFLPQPRCLPWKGRAPSPATTLCRLHQASPAAGGCPGCASLRQRNRRRCAQIDLSFQPAGSVIVCQLDLLPFPQPFPARLPLAQAPPVLRRVRWPPRLLRVHGTGGMSMGRYCGMNTSTICRAGQGHRAGQECGGGSRAGKPDRVGRRGREQLW